MDSAPRALSATTVVARREARSSEISEERTWLRSEVRPLGTWLDEFPPGS